jgi:pyrroline-5-carboxylate reductase
MKTVVFLGAGRITNAIVSGLGLRPARFRVVVHDRKHEKLRAFSKMRGVTAELDLHAALAEADVIVVAVRPDAVRELLRAIGKVNPPIVAVSLAAGVPLRVLKKTLGRPVRWARAMPSPVCSIGAGLTALCFSKEATSVDQKLVGDLFGTVGQVVQLPEGKFDAFTVVYSSSHGYHALEVLAATGQRAGLDRKTSLLASAHALGDGVLAWRQSQRPLQALLDEAATPGGIASATVLAMNAAGYRESVRSGVAAGLRRAKANAKS